MSWWDRYHAKRSSGIGFSFAVKASFAVARISGVRRPRFAVVATMVVMFCSCTRSPAARSNRRSPAANAPAAESIALAEDRPVPPQSASTKPSESSDQLAYAGRDEHGIPRYATIRVSSEDSLLLRRAYGITDPHRLYVSDSSDERILKYDTQRKRCRACFVNSYRVGYVSVRQPGESWEDAERRVRRSSPDVFAAGSRPASTSTADLDPDVRPLSEAMLLAARAAGFRIRVRATYRSPLREAFLMAEGRGRTHTLTSNHSYGRALDIVVDDGNLRHRRTRRDWIAFRRWVIGRRTPSGESFRIIARPDRSWDWPHVELPSSTLGFRTIGEAVARAGACLAPGATTPCNFAPHLPAHLGNRLVQ